MSEPIPQPIRRRLSRHWDARQLLLARRLTVGLLVLLLFFIFRPVYFYIVEHRDFTTCQDNVHKIQRGVWTYAQDFDETLPIGAQWMDSVSGYATGTSGTGQGTSGIFKCPKDTSSAPSSYLFNDLLDGAPLNYQVRGANPAAEARRAHLPSLDRVPLLIESHGKPRNAHASLRNWDDVSGDLTRPHDVPDSTGSVMFGGGRVSSVGAELLEDRRGRRF